MKDYELEIIKSHLELLASQIESSPMTDAGEVCRKIRFISGCITSAEKPRTKTEFVKCEFNRAWEAVKAFEDGEELYTKRSHKDFVLIDNAPDVLRFLYDLHRKVETEIDERQEFIDRMLEMLDFNEAYDGNKIVSDMYGNFGFRFKLVEK